MHILKNKSVRVVRGQDLGFALVSSSTAVPARFPPQILKKTLKINSIPNIFVLDIYSPSYGSAL